jgi:TolB protein
MEEHPLERTAESRRHILPSCTGLALAVVATLVPASPTWSQVRVEGAAQGKARMDWTEFEDRDGGSAAVFAATLKEDLRRSGWFVPAPRGLGEYVLQGGVTASGGRMQAECAVRRVAGGAVLLAKRYSADAQQARRFAHQVADAIVQAVWQRPGMASGRLVMVGNRSGRKELYLCDSDGEGLMQLTRDNSVSVAPKWGPGNQIVYTSFLKGYPDVFLIRVDTGDRDRISSYSGLNTGADLSPDGRDVALVLSKDGNPELYVKNLATDRLTRLTRTRDAAEASPSWSPDGRQIVYVSDASGGPGRPQMYIVDRTGGPPKRVTGYGRENVSPDWGRNGKIAYCSKRDGRYQIAVMDPETLETTLVPTSDGANYEDPSWAPNGRHIACTRTANYQAQVYLLDTLGDPAIALTAYRGGGDWHSPSWSP